MSETAQFTALKIKITTRLIRQGENPEKVIVMIADNFHHAIAYGHTTPAKIAEYLIVMQ